MPRQNRVTPWGEIIATSDRGTFLGNRGILHDEQGHIRRAWQVKRWLVCVLEFRGRKRTVMTPNRYTELFFLDEATALAAGHRPCAECRHKRFLAFAEAWRIHRDDGSPARPTVMEIDNQLHVERVLPDRSKQSFRADLLDLPNGVFVQRAESGDQAFLLWKDWLWAWSPGGYGAPRPRCDRERVLVLTPPSTVGAIRAGYVPEVHASILAQAQ
jgi:hypothetical protein